MRSVSGWAALLAVACALPLARSVRPTPLALGGLGPRWGERHTPLLPQVWDARTSHALETPEISVVDPYPYSANPADIVASVPRGGGGGDDLSQVRRIALGLAVDFAQKHTHSVNQMRAAQRLFVILPGLIAADTDEHGDIREDRQPFWDQVAAPFMHVLRAPHGESHWGTEDTDSADLTSVDIQASVVVEETGEVQGAAALFLALISDAVSLSVWDEISNLLVDPEDIEVEVGEGVQDIVRTHSELEIFGDLLGFVMLHEVWNPDEDQRLDTEDRVLAEQRRLVQSGRMPRRWKRGFVGAILANFIQEASGERAVLLANALAPMMSVIECTPQSLRWWVNAHAYLQKPLNAEGPLSGKAELLQKALLKDVRSRIRDMQQKFGQGALEFGDEPK